MVATFLEYVYWIRRVSIMLLCHLVCDRFQVKSLRMNKGIFWIFSVKNLILTNFNHYSPIFFWGGDFWGFWTLFWMFKFFYLNFFFVMQCSEIYCPFFWHPITLKLSSIIKNISNFIKFIFKNQEKKLQFFWSFYPLLTLLGSSARP